MDGRREMEEGYARETRHGKLVSSQEQPAISKYLSLPAIADAIINNFGGTKIISLKLEDRVRGWANPTITRLGRGKTKNIYRKLERKR